jgi:Flp pilus assembly protein TadG
MLIESQRGQTLPMAALGVVAMLIAGFFGLDYANAIRYQIRAQNVADSAAQAVLSLQTQEFNEMTATLYAASIEEYRIRHLINAMTLAAAGEGGCVPNAAGTSQVGSGCDNTLSQLKTPFLQAVQRYSTDAIMLNDITKTLTYDNAVSDAKAMINQLQTNCGTTSGGDCQFGYAIYVAQRTDTEKVEMDALGILKPEDGTNTGASAVNADLAPIKVEVAVCTTVKSLFPSLLGYAPASYKAIARGAAAAIMTEQDWLQPGTIPNPYTNAPFQPVETYVTNVTHPDGYDWYNLNYGGNTTDAITGAGYRMYLSTDEASAQLGWWNSVPIHPFEGTLIASSMGCTA